MQEVGGSILLDHIKKVTHDVLMGAFCFFGAHRFLYANSNSMQKKESNLLNLKDKVVKLFYELKNELA
ncbi:MAG: hypothetical protein ACQEWF_22285 [Bacillota bacterium]